MDRLDNSKNVTIRPALRVRLGLGRGPGPVMLPEGAERVQVVGDLHGCADLLEALLLRLDMRHPSVFVGDYIDRGPDSRAVLNRLRQLDELPNVTCLMGNHEAMMLDFLRSPEAAGPLWLRAGGEATLRAYGVEVDTQDWVSMGQGLARALGRDMILWLRARPLSTRLGNLAVVHAGADPLRPIESQPADILLWGHPRFRRRMRRDGLWVVHGHVITDSIRAERGRIGVDTGAYRTGRLSAAVFSGPKGLRWVYVDASDVGRP